MNENWDGGPAFPKLNKWHAPFSKEQVKALDRRQADKTLHPYTCPECSEKLIPYDDGWYCSKHGLVQTWALHESAYLSTKEGTNND